MWTLLKDTPTLINRIKNMDMHVINLFGWLVIIEDIAIKVVINEQVWSV